VIALEAAALRASYVKTALAGGMLTRRSHMNDAGPHSAMRTL